jgi:hypothetical protein
MQTSKRTGTIGASAPVIGAMQRSDVISRETILAMSRNMAIKAIRAQIKMVNCQKQAILAEIKCINILIQSKGGIYE